MGVLGTFGRWVRGKRSSGSPRALAALPSEAWFSWADGVTSSSGERVGPRSALSHAPVWQAVNIIAGDLGQLPMRVMRRQDDRVADQPSHPVDWLLNHEPNALQTPSLLKETLQAWALLWGNGIAAIVRDDRGRAEELIPLAPWRVQSVTQKTDGIDGGYAVVYSTLEGRQLVFTPAEVLHVRGLAVDGHWGRSAVEVARNVLGLGIAAREHASATMRNGSVPGGVIAAPNAMTADAIRQTRSDWEEVHAGARKASRVAVLTGGATYTPVAMSNRDAELLALMRLDREQVASLFNLPAFKLNALENAAVRANVAESNREYYATTLSRWAMRFGEEATRKLLTRPERRQGYYVKVDAEALTAGSPDDRMKRASRGVRARLMTRNEGRDLIGLNPVDGGDEFENPAIDVSGSAGAPEDVE